MRHLRLDCSLIVTLSHHFPLSNPTSGHREYLQFLKCMWNNSFHTIHLCPSNHSCFRKFLNPFGQEGHSALQILFFFYSIYHIMFNCLLFLLLDHTLHEDRDHASLAHNLKPRDKHIAMLWIPRCKWTERNKRKLTDWLLNSYNWPIFSGDFGSKREGKNELKVCHLGCKVKWEKDEGFWK